MKLSEGLRRGMELKQKLLHPYCAAVIVAAGTSSRMGGTNKILTVLENLPVICRTVDTFDRCDLIDEIIFQKRIEFWGEGVIFYDLKRLNIGMHNGDTGTNAPPMAQLSTDGRAPWWNCVFPLNAVQQNKALAGKNNPNPTQTVKSVK